MNPTTDPHELVELFLQSTRNEVSGATHRKYRTRLNQFLKWCDRQELNDLSEITGMDLLEFKLHRQNEDGLKKVTLRNQLYTLRVFIRFCESVDVVTEGLAENIQTPSLARNEAVRDTTIEPEQVNKILDYCEKFEYATARHTVFLLLWHTGIRLGTLRSLDLDDYHSHEKTDTDLGYIVINHRPNSDTPLKNKKAAERQINLFPAVCEVIDDYIQMNRDDVKDDYERKPLFTSKQGRLYDTPLRQYINTLTRPCHYTGECPHDRDLEDCEATKYEKAGRCPSSVSPHPVRRSAITHHLNLDWAKEDASERMNVSGKVLDKHYDARTEDEKRAKRADRYFGGEE